MLESIAGAAMDMSAARFSVEYSMAVTKKVMDTQELAAQELLEMLDVRLLDHFIVAGTETVSMAERGLV